jgi:hypothetical protein
VDGYSSGWGRLAGRPDEPFPNLSSMEDKFAAGRDFILRQGRLLERRLFAVCFEDAPGSGVVDVLRGYRNDDGGFGHGLEPDKRCPASLPIDVEVALQALTTAEASDRSLALAACDYLAGVASAAKCHGAVPLAFPVIEAFPRAVHWTDWTYEPGLNPTAGIVGLLQQMGVAHPWLAQAASFCWDRLDNDELPNDAHALGEVLVFLEHSPESNRAEAAAAKVWGHLGKAALFRTDPDDPGYGLSPLSFAPLAESRWRALFSNDVLAAHLDRLQRDQQADGGWPITWEPPSEAALLEWRGVVTLGALRTLVSYGRLTPSPQLARQTSGLA